MTRNGFAVYQNYIALQRHFTSDYDWFKYQGKTNVSVKSYENRNDMLSFEKVAKIIPEEDYVDFFVCHFLENPKEYIRNMSKTNLDSYKNKISNLPQIFKTDLEFLKNEGMADCLKIVSSSEIPKIHTHTISGNINIESVVILDTLLPFIDKHQNEVKVPFLFPQHITKVTKYKPFLFRHVEPKQNVFKWTAKKVFTVENK